MKRTQIKVYTKFGKIEESTNFYAIKDDDVIKYIDLDNNKMIINMNNYTIIKENIDYIFNLEFEKNNIVIEIKRLHRIINKSIKTLKIEKTKRSFLARYLLEDEQEINEYYIKF